MLELRPNCECCDKDLPPDSDEARICSYECTFCSTCVDTIFNNVCPNCGGGFVQRPIRPKEAWRANTGLAYNPPSDRRRHTKYTREELVAFTAPISKFAPKDR